MVHIHHQTNHCKHHPFAFDEGQPYTVLDEPFDKMTSREYSESDPVVYKTEVDFVYKTHPNPNRIKPDGWFLITDRENYLRLSRETREELEDVFGKGSVKSFVWPYREQTNSVLFEALTKDGYNSIRKTGALGDSTNFDLPEDRMRWSYNATNKTLLEIMEKYEAYEDDGRLKFFAFGVHSRDFEVSENWCDLEKFAEKYGNRPSDYYYATVSDIFEYEDAVKALVIGDDIVNNSDREIFLSLDGERVTVKPHSSVSL